MNIFPVGPKIYPKANVNSFALDMKMGGEVRKTIFSQQSLQGHNNKFVGYKDASQLTRIRATIQVSKQMENTNPNKFRSPNTVKDALRRTRNAGTIVPPKVRNKGLV